MPVYIYRVVKPLGQASGGGGETFEVHQSIHDPPLTHHPETGEPVERVLCPPTIGKGAMSNSDLASAGFTKYKRTADGTYERQAGRGGPKHIDPGRK
jgi:predicted nucleic acid-binding Zn ribbon protein